MNRMTSSSAEPRTASMSRTAKNARIQVFDQDGKFIAAWKQFGEPSSVFVGKDDTIYVGAAFPDASVKKGQLRAGLSSVMRRTAR